MMTKKTEKILDEKVLNKYGLKCPKPECGSTQIWRVGFVPTIGGRKDRFKCSMCATSFYEGHPGTDATEKPKPKIKPKTEPKKPKKVKKESQFCG